MAVRAFGTFPGAELDEALNVVAGELSSSFFLPSLPQRGPESSALARTAALFEEIHWSLGLRAFEMHTRTSQFSRAIKERWERDWDVFLAAVDKHELSESSVMVSLPGPYTIASAVELPNGHWVVTDSGAVKHLVEELSGAINSFSERLYRDTGCVPVVVVDETAAGAALAGHQPGAHRFEDIPKPAPELVVSQWKEISKALHGTGHDTNCCVVRFPATHCEWMSYLPELDAALKDPEGLRIAFDIVDCASWSTSEIDAFGERCEMWGNALELMALHGGSSRGQTERAHTVAKRLHQLGAATSTDDRPVLHSVHDLALDTVTQATDHLRELSRYPEILESEWVSN